MSVSRLLPAHTFTHTHTHTHTLQSADFAGDLVMLWQARGVAFREADTEGVVKHIVYFTSKCQHQCPCVWSFVRECVCVGVHVRVRVRARVCVCVRVYVCVEADAEGVVKHIVYFTSK